MVDLPANLTDLLTRYSTRLLIAGLMTIGGYWIMKLVLRAIGRYLNGNYRTSHCHLPADTISPVNYAVQEAVARQFVQDGISGPRTEIDELQFRVASR